MRRDEIAERYPEAVILSEEFYDEAIIGISNDDRVVYSYQGLVEALMRHDGMSEEDAEEWVSYNVLGSLYGENMPIVCMMEE